ncbi:MAG: ShlB/FhaC/HecB family hemolysin secretion/activation protein [Rhodospirillaceae bacterium]
MLAAVNITGASVYGLSEFAPLYESYLGQRISTDEIRKIVEAITRKYTDDGYFLSSATAPRQDISFGILSVRVTEGYIREVVFSGERPGRQELFERWAAKITQSVPARLSEIERYVLLMGDLPGLTARPSLNEPDSGEQAYRMTVNLSLDRFDGAASLDNRGTNPVGPLQVSLSGGMNSAAGLLERTRLSLFTVPDEPRELLYGEIYEQLPVGEEGTAVWASVSRSKVDIYSESRASRLQSTGDRLSAGFWHPLIRSQELALYVNGRFDYANSRQSAIDDDFDDRLRVARAGIRLWFRDALEGTTNLSFEYSRGLDMMGASPRGYRVSRTDGESEFDKTTFDVNRVQKITEDLWAELNARGQHSVNILLSGEEFALGGSRFGRGYDPSEISDSRGLAGSIELRHRLALDDGALSQLWFYGFYDAGAVWRADGTRDSIVSAGAGIRIFPWEGTVASLEIAKPLTRTVSEEDNTDARLFFSLSASF